jgi:tRNA A-37 threonylcarbamoyl transferase component Bud32
VVLLLLALPLGAEAQRRGDPSERAWRTIKRVPRQLGVATGRALRELEAGVEQGLREAGRRPPELPPEPDPAEDPLDAPGVAEGALPERWDPALDPLFDDEPTPEPAPDPEPVEPRRVLASDAATAIEAPAPAARGTPTGAAPRRALLALLAAALFGGVLAWHRRRSPGRPAAPPPAAAPAPAPAPPLPPKTTVVVAPSSERTTRPRHVPASLAVHSEAALADALARDAATPAPFPGGGRYELLGEVGRGGMGVVYRARDKRLDRIVALKRLPDHLQASPRAVQLLLREARSAAQLNHPNIVTVYDVDHEDGAYFLTMEFLEGHPLATLLHRRGRFLAGEVAWLGRQAAAGLAYAHQRRIVHRDVKTANLFLTRERVLKIMDFGLAKMMEAVRRRATRIGGTPDYMAPEQGLGHEVDGRADLYALGATLHELLTGVVPFEEGDLARHHRETPPPDPRERVPDVPAALAELVLQLLAKEPADRPGSAAEVAERLRAVERAAARS